MLKKYLLVISIAMLAIGCGRSQSGRQTPDLNSVNTPAAPAQSATPDDTFEREIGDSKGVIVLTDKYGEEDTIRIFNRDGSPWYEFSYYDESGFDELENLNTDFRPFAFHPDYFLLALRVVGEDDRNWEVVVNEESDLRKYVRKNDENLAYEDFGPHILTAFAVEFDSEQNPLRTEPDGKKVEADYSKISRFEPVEYEGDWLKVKWTDTEGEGEASANKEPSTPDGWVRWKNGSKMIIRIYYLS